MKLLDNTNSLLGDDLKETIQPGARLKIAASCFSLYAFEALKTELAKIDNLQFIFTAPTFVAAEVTDRLRKERREFFIPKLGRETSLYGTEFEIHLRNQLTQRAIARECAEWIRRKARFKSNCTKAPMQAFAHIGTEGGDAAYMPLNGFTVADLGYQKGDAVSNFVSEGVKTKVLMLSATPVNNRFADLRNQLALAYEGHSETLSQQLHSNNSVEETFRQAQKAFNSWSQLPPEQRTAASILKTLDFDFFELLDAVTIARSRPGCSASADCTAVASPAPTRPRLRLKAATTINPC